MTTISDITKKYYKLIAPLDMELIFSHALNKSCEFVLAHPEYKIPATRNSKLSTLFKRRIAGEPMAYILGKKEFYGLDFKVNKNTLIPRPETELLVELALKEVRKLVSKHLRTNLRTVNIVDVGTGSGNIVISLAHNAKREAQNHLKFYGIDTSYKALAIAKQNAKVHKLDKKIKFLQGNLLDPIPKSYPPAGEAGKLKAKSWIILANLPYLSPKIYASAPKDVRDYEPKTALISPRNGLKHYEDLLKQIYELVASYGLQVTSFLEISPEQKALLQKMIREVAPSANTTFYRDLAKKWRICQIDL